MIEREVKIQISEDKFKEIYDNYLFPAPFVRQQNILFELDSGFLRVRKEVTKQLITVKGENRGSDFNEREETECEMENTLLFDKLLEMKSRSAICYEKIRAIRKYVGCEVALDILEDNRRYIELEGTKKGIEEYLKKFGLEGMEIERRSYLELIRGEKNDMYRKNI